MAIAPKRHRHARGGDGEMSGKSARLRKLTAETAFFRPAPLAAGAGDCGSNVLNFIAMNSGATMSLQPCHDESQLLCAFDLSLKMKEVELTRFLAESWKLHGFDLSRVRRTEAAWSSS